MTTYLLSGLQRVGITLSHICVTDKNADKLAVLAQTFSVQTSQDNVAAIKAAKVVILAIKPQSLPDFASECVNAFSQETLVISILAGIPIAKLSELLGPLSFIRAMPNILVSLGQGNTLLFTRPHALVQHGQFAQDLFAHLGLSLWLDEEDLMEAYTVLTGCGPGYVFFMMQTVIDAAANLGIPEEQAKASVLQLFTGAAQMAAQNHTSLIELQERVASKKGMTEKILTFLKRSDMEGIFKQAFLDAYTHGQQLQHHKEEK